MFDTRKFGGYLSRLRKKADMTQSELADRLNVTRQAVSKYELGDSFPDISILVEIAQVFGVTLDELINAGEPTKGEAAILEKIAKNESIPLGTVSDIVNLAPLLKPSVLDKIADNLMKQGIDFDVINIIKLAEFMNDESILKMLENTDKDELNPELIEKLIPFLDEKSKGKIFEKILEGKLDWHLIITLYPYFDFLNSQIEAAVIEGAIPYEALKLMREERRNLYLNQKAFDY